MGTHPIFESDFDCLTENDMRLAHASVLGTLFASNFDELVTENLTEFNLKNGIANSSCDPNSPLIPCAFLPNELVECQLKIHDQKLEKISSNSTLQKEDYCFESNYANSSFGAQNYEDVKRVWSECQPVSAQIECCGSRLFYRKLPCLKYTHDEDGNCRYNFPTAVILSLFLGIGGADRFYMGLTPTAVGKLFTLGGLGVWWIIDLILILSGGVMPAEDSSWCLNY